MTFARISFVSIFGMVVMQRQRMNDVLLQARVVVRTSNMKFYVVVWRADYVKILLQNFTPKSSTIIFLPSTNQIIYLKRCRCRRHFLNSLFAKVDWTLFPESFASQLYYQFFVARDRSFSIRQQQSILWTPVTQMVIFNQGMLFQGSNHFLRVKITKYKSNKAPGILSNCELYFWEGLQGINYL